MKIWGIVVLFVLASLITLVYTAGQGMINSIVILTIIATEALNLVGVGIVLLVMRLMEHREQKAFRDNTKENLAIMLAMQKTQNQLNAGLVQQVNAVSRVPVQNTMSPLLIDDGIFDDLED
jgi:uncharacterized membrane protein